MYSFALENVRRLTDLPSRQLRSPNTAGWLTSTRSSQAVWFVGIGLMPRRQNLAYFVILKTEPFVPSNVQEK